jgi:hypothetical protein
MLYKLGKSAQKFTSIEPLPFSRLPLEKHLEDLLAQNLFDVLFEDSPLMPILQERSRQAEADIYALNRQGELVIFELKRDRVDGGAVHQALRYCERASRYTFEHLEAKLAAYTGAKSVNLQTEHQSAFDLEHPLDRSAFNKKQHLYIIGNAGDQDLIDNVRYWQSQGLLIQFLPYRIYQIGNNHYFEFFALPYDQHSNPDNVRGILFDTNRSYDQESIWYMCNNARVAAFGSIKGIVRSLSKNDVIFLYHKGCGIVAAGSVSSNVVKEDAAQDAMYRDLKWLTAVPTKDKPLRAMSVSKIKAATGHEFWWAKTMKAPFLNKEEAAQLLKSLKKVLSQSE